MIDLNDQQLKYIQENIGLSVSFIVRSDTGEVIGWSFDEESTVEGGRIIERCAASMSVLLVSGNKDQVEALIVMIKKASL